MGERHLALEKNGPKRLSLVWTGNWKNIEVQLDGRPLGPSIEDFAALKAGRHYSMPDGRVLRVAFKLKKYGAGGLDITLDGATLPDLAGDPKKTVRWAAITLWIIAGLNLVGAIYGLSRGRAFRNVGGAWFFLTIGVVLAILGAFVLWRRSRLALALALVIEIGNTVIHLILVVDVGAGLGADYVLYLHILAFIAIVKAYGAVARIYKMEREALIDTFR